MPAQRQRACHADELMLALATPPAGIQQTNAVYSNPDWNKDRKVDGADVVAFLDDLVQGGGDFDRNHATTSADVYAFFNAFFAGESPKTIAKRSGGGR